MGKLDGLAQPMGELDGQHKKKVGFRKLFAVSRVARGIPSVMYRQYFGTIFPSRTRHMAGVEGCSVVVQHKKSLISGVIRCISRCTRDSFGIVPAAFRCDISKSHAAYGRG